MFEFFKWVFIKEAILHAFGCIGAFLFYVLMIIIVWVLIEVLVMLAKDNRKRGKKK